MQGPETGTAGGDLARRVEGYAWYHTLDLGDGVVTQGMFDHRPALERYGLPEDLSGMRCLDVGTMDGFWAFEMERRGADEVVAVDLADPTALDWPAPLRGSHDTTLDSTKAERFALARETLGSRVQRVERSVYELGPDLGRFDFVFCGDLLLHLKEPVTAVERLHSVCAGSAMIVNPVKRFRFMDRRPLAELDGLDRFEWWTTNLAGLERLVRAGGFTRVESRKPFEVPFTGGDWRGLRGVVRAWP